MIKEILLIMAILLFTACGNKENGVVVTVFKTDKETHEQPVVAYNDSVVNYLNALQTIDFEGTKYNLAWSNPPQMNGTYYIQEYMPDGQNLDRYDQIFILDLFNDKKTSLEAEVKEKTDWLDNRKKSGDPRAQYTVSHDEKNKEYRVSLIVSSGNQVEWDLIRYKSYEQDGKFAGVKTFTLSKRGYEGFDKFKDFLKREESKLTDNFMELPFPVVKP